MTVDCVDSSEEIPDLFDREFFDQPLWNGRAIQVLFDQNRFYQLLETAMGFLNAENGQQHTYTLIDLSEEIVEEISSHLDDYATLSYEVAFHHPLNQRMALLNPSQYQSDIIRCRTALKSALKALEKAGKKTAKFVKKGTKEVINGAKKTANFAKDHKKEIFIGAGAVALGVGLYYFAGLLASSTAGAGALEALKRKRDEEEDSEEQPASDQIPSRQVYPDQLHSNPANLQKPLPEPTTSCHVQTEGIEKSGIAIGFINGMNTSYQECKNHLEHIKQFVGDLRVEGVYNHSNTAPVDLAEIITLNYAGIAPNTSDLLIENWTRFHKENRNNPEAKYLQFTHSMGTIQTKVALERAELEIRERVIVVAIGPAVIIPEGLCHNAFHYASKNDPVHLGENGYKHLIAAFNHREERILLLNELINKEEQLIILEPHPNANKFDHDFESPTYELIIEQNVGVYLNEKLA